MSEPSLPSPTASLPDPSLFVAITTPLDESAWTAAMRADAANSGWLLGARTRTIAAWGTAAVLPLPRGLDDEESVAAATAWLAALPHRPHRPHRPHLPAATGDRDRDTDFRRDGGAAQGVPRPCALGALAFDRGAPGALVVPATVIERSRDGRVWRTDVTRRDHLQEAGSGPAPRVGSEPPAPLPSSPISGESDAPGRQSPGPDGSVHGTARVREVPAGSAYAVAVARALQDIGTGAISKVVLSRSVHLTLPHPALASDVLAALWGGDDALSPYSAPTPEGRLVGASPELIVGRIGRSVTSHAFAGTVALPRGEVRGSHEEAASRLFASVKDRAEHAFVVQEIAKALATRCESVSVPEAPSVLDMRSDARLGTLIRATLAEASPGEVSMRSSALQLLALLHPTPAVGGLPRDAALQRIAALEPRSRGYWAGVVGWADGEGDGEWVLAIRNALLHEDSATVRAGAGIVAGSEPQAELGETTVKLTAALEAVWPGASRSL